MNAAPESISTAIQYLQAGRFAESERVCRVLLQAQPNQVEALHLLGILLSQSGRNAEAAESIRTAIAIGPATSLMYSNLGLVLNTMGRFDEAIDCYRQALSLEPDDHGSHNRLGIALQRQNRLDEAIASFRDALNLKPDFYQAHNNLGHAFEQRNEFEAAIRCYREAIRLKPDYAGAYSNLGNALKAVGQLEDAVECHRLAVRYQPDFAEAHCNLANALKELGDVKEALASYRAALSLKPDSPRVRSNLGIALLQTGDFPSGWREYEWRIQEKSLPVFDKPRWDGSSLGGRRILLIAEQGLGDTLQFIRYAPIVKELGGHIILACQPALIGLLKDGHGIDEIVPISGKFEVTLSPFDVYLHLLSLPKVLGTTVESIPNQVPYLFAQQQLTAQWQHELESVPGLRVGVAWQGSRANPIDRTRSIPLSEFEPIANIQGIQLICLQKGDGSEQIHPLSRKVPLINLTDRMDVSTGPFLDTAAIMMNLDLVVTSDTSVAHLAGALGVPVWVALSKSADWRWMTDRADSPWYPTMRLFRQEVRGDWSGVFKRITDRLRVWKFENKNRS